jgi:uncharacterized cofD-like protein
MDKIVVIGGGTGSFSVLRAIKGLNVDITSVVSTFDSGGSTGVLRDEFGTLPSGDIRRALVALAPEKAENTLRDLFMYRFADKPSLKGHSFGNLFLAALADIKGSDLKGIKTAGKLLGIKGRVLPVSIEKSHIIAELEDGTTVKGESKIADFPEHDGSLRIKKLHLDNGSKLVSQARDAIVEADYIIFAPGDLHTSLIPNFLVKGMAEALEKSKAKVIYFSNIMTKWGDTHGYKLSDFLSEILKYSKLEALDYVFADEGSHGKDILKEYEQANQFPVKIDKGAKDFVINPIVVDDFCHEESLVRHDEAKIALYVDKLLKGSELRQ